MNYNFNLLINNSYLLIDSMAALVKVVGSDIKSQQQKSLLINLARFSL